MIRSLAAASVGAAASLFLGGLPALATTPNTAASNGVLVSAPHGLRPTSPATTGHAATEQSENWSGYIRSGSTGSYTSSIASWTVPAVSTANDGYSSTWVGMDGATSGDGYLIQTGTEADVVDGQASYDAWWEVITPSDEAPETLFSNINVSPGDAITASVTKASSTRWTLKLTDETSGVSGTHTASYAGTGESAEWIQEDTDVNNEISPAPDWKSVTFDDITLNGDNPDLKAGDAINIVDSQGTQEDSTGSPNSADNGFTVTWLANGSPTPID